MDFSLLFLLDLLRVVLKKGKKSSVAPACLSALLTMCLGKKSCHLHSKLFWYGLSVFLQVQTTVCSPGPTAALASSQPEPDKSCHGAEQTAYWVMELLASEEPDLIHNSWLPFPPCLHLPVQTRRRNYPASPVGNSGWWRWPIICTAPKETGKIILEARRFCFLSPERLLSLVSEGFGGSILLHGKTE